jgi:hypothetical protein
LEKLPKLSGRRLSDNADALCTPRLQHRLRFARWYITATALLDSLPLLDSLTLLIEPLNRDEWPKGNRSPKWIIATLTTALEDGDGRLCTPSFRNELLRPCDPSYRKNRRVRVWLG